MRFLWSFAFVLPVCMVVLGVAFAVGEQPWLSWYFGTMGGAGYVLFFADRVINDLRRDLDRAITIAERQNETGRMLVAQLATTQAKAMDILTWKRP